MADLGVDGIGEVDGGGVLGKGHDVALRGEDVNLRGIDLETQRIQELAGIGLLLGPLVERLYPGQVGAVRLNPLANGVGVLLVLPVGRNTVLSPPVHLVSTDLQFHRLPAGPQHGGVQGLVHVVLRHRDVVLEPPWEGVPSHMHDAQCGITVARGVDEDAQTDEIVDV